MLVNNTVNNLYKLLKFITPTASNNNFGLVPVTATKGFDVKVLIFVFITQIVAALLYFSSNTPNNVFTPVLTLNAILKATFKVITIRLFPRCRLRTKAFTVTKVKTLLTTSVHTPLAKVVLILRVASGCRLVLPVVVANLNTALLTRFANKGPLCSTVLTHALTGRRTRRLTQDGTTSTDRGA